MAELERERLERKELHATWPWQITNQLHTNITCTAEQYLQGSANPQTPGSENKRIKSCVLLTAAGRRKQLFHLIFTEQGVCGFADPCKLPTRWMSGGYF